MLRLKSCGLAEGGGRALAEALRLNTTVTSPYLHGIGLGEGRGRALAKALRRNTVTVTSLNLGGNGLGDGALAEALRLNTTLASLDLRENGLGEGGGRALVEALRLNTTVTSLNLGLVMDRATFSLGRQAPACRRTLIPSTLMRGTPRAAGLRSLYFLASYSLCFVVSHYVSRTHPPSLRGLVGQRKRVVTRSPSPPARANDLREEGQSALGQAWGKDIGEKRREEDRRAGREDQVL